jgi:hypothetical protein
MGKPLPLTLLVVINPCHLHDPNGMSQPDEINKTLSKHGVHFATEWSGKNTTLAELGTDGPVWFQDPLQYPLSV